ncbi:MAG: AAA family ATPase [Nitrospirae bacterium]|nr:AAA family ATPase [Nitrospirota bacterium]
MFSIKTLELVYWDFWDRIKIPLDEKITVIVGPNGSGKTTILDALRTLLGARKLSTKRDYKKYARRSNMPYSWIIAVVNNEKQGNRRPFAPQFISDSVTLACRIEKKGGEWAREYFIRSGIVHLEEFIKDSPNALGPIEYVQELEKAGLSKAMLKVLSLEQGETDKLCDYSPKEMLDLVFDFSGDRSALEDYEKSRKDHNEAEAELNLFRVNFSKLENERSTLNNRVLNYHQYCRRNSELTTLESETKTIAEYVSAKDIIEGQRPNIRFLKAEVSDIGGSIPTLEGEVKKAKIIEAHLKDEIKSAREEKKKIEDELQKKYKTHSELVAKIENIEQLAESVQNVQPESLENLEREHEELIKGKGRLEDEKKPLDEQIKQYAKLLRDLEKGILPPQEEILTFSNTLKVSGIEHALLYEGVEILQEKWSTAIESILRGYRYVVMLKKKEDKWKAFEIGEQLGYRHFIVPEAGEKGIKAPANSALSVVRLQDFVPDWIRRNLAEITLVDEVRDGKRLPEGVIFVTRQGYMREKRGGRFIGVSAGDFVFGKAAIKRQIEEVTRRNAEAKARLADIANGLSERESDIRKRALRIDAQKRLSEYLEKKDLAGIYIKERDALQTELGGLENRRKSLQDKDDDLGEQLQDMTTPKVEKERELKELQEKFKEKSETFEKGKKEYFDNIAKFRQVKKGMPVKWRSPEKIADYKDKYANLKGVESAIKRLKNELESEEWEKDPSVVDMLNKIEIDYENAKNNLAKRQTEFTNTKAAVDKAREKYLKVLWGSIVFYEKNLKALASLAHIGIEVRKPQLATEEDLREAGLEMRWNFDEKGFSSTDDGDASGGQQVIKSLILLIALIMDEKSKGGFIFIDEPFAHLDVFNIDKVSEFLQATETQFIITSPNTHNANIFRPAGLSINTLKKRPGETYAPIPTHCRRSPVNVSA